MRHSSLTVLAVVACILGSVAVILELTRRDTRSASGQAGSGISAGNIVLATAVNSPASETLVFVYDGTQQSVACYATRKQGLELRGVRKIEWDVQIHEFPMPRSDDPRSVDAVKKELARQQQQARQQTQPQVQQL